MTNKLMDDEEFNERVADLADLVADIVSDFLESADNSLDEYHRVFTVTLPVAALGTVVARYIKGVETAIPELAAEMREGVTKQVYGIDTETQ